MESEPEVFLPVAGHEGRYEVSNLGRVRSLPRGPLGKIRYLGSKGQYGHMSVCLVKGQVKKYPLISALVANAFLSQPVELINPIVKHLDGDLSNCSASNLGWQTRSEITKSYCRRGAGNAGGKHRSTTLTDEVVVKIRELYATVPAKKIAEMFSTSRKAVNNIAAGRTWTHLPILQYSERKQKLYAPRPDFIEAARAIHGADKYDYSQVVYVRTLVPVTILCPVHGAFIQTPNTHLQGSGCPACGLESRKEKARLDWVELAQGRIAVLYFIRLFNEVESFYKIGVAVDIKARWARQRTRPGYNYELIAEYKSMNALAVWEWEQSILESFAHLSYRPKTYFEGRTECFSSCEEILSIFPL